MFRQVHVHMCCVWGVCAGFADAFQKRANDATQLDLNNALGYDVVPGSASVSDPNTDNGSGSSSSSNGGAIAAAVLVPLFVIAVIVGIVIYKKKHGGLNMPSIGKVRFSVECRG